MMHSLYPPRNYHPAAAAAAAAAAPLPSLCFENTNDRCFSGVHFHERLLSGESDRTMPASPLENCITTYNNHNYNYNNHNEKITRRKRRGGTGIYFEVSKRQVVELQETTGCLHPLQATTSSHGQHDDTTSSSINGQNHPSSSLSSLSSSHLLPPPKIPCPAGQPLFAPPVLPSTLQVPDDEQLKEALKREEGALCFDPRFQQWAQQLARGNIAAAATTHDNHRSSNTFCCTNSSNTNCGGAAAGLGMDTTDSNTNPTVSVHTTTTTATATISSTKQNPIHNSNQAALDSLFCETKRTALRERLHSRDYRLSKDELVFVEAAAKLSSKVIFPSATDAAPVMVATNSTINNHSTGNNIDHKYHNNELGIKRGMCKGDTFNSTHSATILTKPVLPLLGRF